MFLFQVANLVTHNRVYFALAQMTEQRRGQHHGIVAARKSVRQLRFAFGQHVDLFQFDAGPRGKLENAVAQLSPGN